MDYRIEQLRYHLREDPTSRRFYQLGELLRKEGELEEAAQILREGLKQHSRYVAAWVSLGRTLCAQGAHSEGEEAFAKALELDPENAVAARMIGRAAMERGEWLRAVKALKLARALSPRDEELEEEIASVERKLAGIGQLEGGPPPLPGEEPAPAGGAAAPAVEQAGFEEQPAPPPMAPGVPQAPAPFAEGGEVAPVQPLFGDVPEADGAFSADDPFGGGRPDAVPEETSETGVGAQASVAEPVAPPFEEDDPFAAEPAAPAADVPAGEAAPPGEVFWDEPGPMAGPMEGGGSDPLAGGQAREPEEAQDPFAMTSDDPLSVAAPVQERDADDDVFGGGGAPGPEPETVGEVAEELAPSGGDVFAQATEVAAEVVPETQSAPLEPAWDLPAEAPAPVAEAPVGGLDGLGGPMPPVAAFEPAEHSLPPAPVPQGSDWSLPDEVPELEPEPAPDLDGATQLASEPDLGEEADLPMPTLTLARLARDQGDLELAARTVSSILSREPENEAAKALLSEIEAVRSGGAPAAAPAADPTEAKVAALRRWLRTVKLAAERRAT